MRTLASCYSDHAVKVSDSYKSFNPPKHLPSSVPNAVVYTYKLNHVLFAIAWSTKLAHRGFWIVGSSHVRMGAEKGKERFAASGSIVEVEWNLSNDINVVVLVDSVPSLVLGESTPRVERVLVAQCEYLSELTEFRTRAKFKETGKVHEILIRCGAEVGGYGVGPVLTVVIDRRTVVRATRLRWNFRGNQVVFVEGDTVDVMWDLNRWMNREKSTVDDGGYDGVIFRRRSELSSWIWIDEGRQNEFCFMVCVLPNR